MVFIRGTLNLCQIHHNADLFIISQYHNTVFFYISFIFALQILYIYITSVVNDMPHVIRNVVRMFFIAAPTEKDCDKTSAAQLQWT